MEKLSIEEAIRAYTLNTAYAALEDEITDIKVLQTVVGGSSVYTKN